jgi:hypothetical protein
VSIVAMRHDVNANKLFKGRHELAGSTPAAATLVPVAVMPERVQGTLAKAFGCMGGIAGSALSSTPSAAMPPASFSPLHFRPLSPAPSSPAGRR